MYTVPWGVGVLGVLLHHPFPQIPAHPIQALDPPPGPTLAHLTEPADRDAYRAPPTWAALLVIGGQARYDSDPY